MKHPPHPKLSEYVRLVRLWAPRIDLVSPGDLDRFAARHVHDSLRILELVGAAPEGPGVDVGSGAGLPGIPLAIVAPERRWRLLEPRSKRAAFLDEVVRELELDCEVLRVRAEDAARDPLLAGAHAVATARALAPPLQAFPLLLPLLRPGGRAIVFAGETGELPSDADVPLEGIGIMTASRATS